MNIRLSRGSRTALWAAMAFGLAGCASAPAQPESSGSQWRRVASVPGCVSASSKWDLANEISIRLQPELQETLMGQLARQPLEDPRCWYQIPGGDLLLRAGSFCGLSKEAQFHHDGSRWALVRIEDILGQCGTQLQ